MAKGLSIVTLVLTVLAAAPPLPAQHGGHGHSHGHGHGYGHGQGHHGMVHHHGRHYGHNNWTYVVPQYDVQRYRGNYYVQSGVYYYTPTPVTRVVVGAQPTPVVPAPVMQQPVAVKFGGFARCDDLAGRLETEMNRLCLDLHYNYRGNLGYQEQYGEAYALLQSARYVHDKEHQRDNEAIRGEVKKMDQTFHQLQIGLRQWTRYPQRQIAAGDAVDKASNVEALLHHLCHDVGIEPHEELDEQAPPPDGEELAPPPSASIIRKATGR